MKYRFILFLLIVFAISCSTPEKVVKFNVSNFKQLDSITENYFVYSLPQTSLRIQFEVTKTELIPGPYSEYAEILLGLDNIIEDYEVQHEIADITIDSYLEPDPNEYYVVQFDSNFFDFEYQLSNLGFLQSINDTNVLMYNNPLPSGIKNISNSADFYFGNTDRFVKRNIESKKQKKYRTVKTDSSSYRVPYTTTTYEAKSIKVNAEEAANFIIKTRKRKFKLMAGMYDNPPDDVAVPEMIKKMEELEQKYVEMFTGIEIKTTDYFVFDYTPDPNNAIKQYTLCYFSKNKGILTLQDLSSSPNLEKGLNIKPLNINIDAGLSFQSSLEDVSDKIIEKSIVYRFPIFTNVVLANGNDIVYSKKMYINQFGNKLYVPVHPNKPFRVIFDPNNGALRTIDLN